MDKCIECWELHMITCKNIASGKILIAHVSAAPSVENAEKQCREY